MENRKKLIFKLIAGVAAIALISGILFIVNAFVGNPISAMRANSKIEKYVNENYASLNLEIRKAKYNFKDVSYVARVRSNTSIDTKFNVYYRDGEVKRDDYSSYVSGMFNTLQRLSDEYTVIAKDIVSKELGYEENTTMVNYNRDHDVLELDMKFDKSLPMDSEVTIRVDLEDYSLETITKVLTDAHKSFIENDCYFTEYGLYAENHGGYVSVHGVTPNDIESGEFVSRLKEGKINDSVDGIKVTIKEE